MDLKKGDRIKCIDVDMSLLDPHQIYTILEVDRQYIRVSGVYNWYRAKRFKKICLQLVR